MGRLTKLRELWLWGNELEGPIPDLSGMTGIGTNQVADQQFHGFSIPAWFGDMTDLVYLYLHENSLTGEYPLRVGRYGQSAVPVAPHQRVGGSVSHLSWVSSPTFGT